MILAGFSSSTPREKTVRSRHITHGGPVVHMVTSPSAICHVSNSHNLSVKKEGEYCNVHPTTSLPPWQVIHSIPAQCNEALVKSQLLYPSPLPELSCIYMAYIKAMSPTTCQH